MSMMVLVIASMSLPSIAASVVSDEEKAAVDREFILAPGDFEITFGDPNAPVVVTEYASLSCGHCKKFHADIFDKIKEPYIDSGKVYFVFRYFPLNLPALRATQLLHCLPTDAQKRTFLSALFKAQSEWAFEKEEDAFLEKIKTIARIGAINTAGFDNCIANKDLEDMILMHQMTSSKQAGVRATPAIFINGDKYVDDKLLKPFTAALGKALKQAEKN